LFIKIGSLSQKGLVSKNNYKIIQFKESLILQPHFEHFELITILITTMGIHVGGPWNASFSFPNTFTKFLKWPM
jgi:hypothetical protein